MILTRQYHEDNGHSALPNLQQLELFQTVPTARIQMEDKEEASESKIEICRNWYIVNSVRVSYLRRVPDALSAKELFFLALFRYLLTS